MNIVLFASGAFAIPSLDALVEHHHIPLIVTQPDRPAGRGLHLSPNPLAAHAASRYHSIPILKTANASDSPDLLQLRDTHADAFVVIAFGQKLSHELLHDRFAINLHASLLPRWRGAAPIHHAILAGDRETGNSVITLADRMDAGLILATQSRPIPPTITTGELHDLLAREGAPLILETLSNFAANTLAPHTQDETLVTPAPKISRKLAHISPAAQSAEHCRRVINALSPRPGVTTKLGPHPLKLLRAASSPADSQSTPGSLIDPIQGLISCADRSTLHLLDVQPPGKPPMTWPEFARGRPLSTDLLLTCEQPS